MLLCINSPSPICHPLPFVHRLRSPFVSQRCHPPLFESGLSSIRDRTLLDYVLGPLLWWFFKRIGRLFSDGTPPRLDTTQREEGTGTGVEGVHQPVRVVTLQSSISQIKSKKVVDQDTEDKLEVFEVDL